MEKGMADDESADHKKAQSSQILQHELNQLQSDSYMNIDMRGHKWLRCNINPKKPSVIINMKAKMIETRA